MGEITVEGRAGASGTVAPSLEGLGAYWFRRLVFEIWFHGLRMGQKLVA